MLLAVVHDHPYIVHRVASERAALSDSEYSLPGAQTELSDEERARKLLDDSRYTE